MPQASFKRVAAMSVLLSALIAMPSEARPPHRDGKAAEQVQAEGHTPVDRNRAAAIVERATGGRVLAVETAVSGGRTAHRVKVLLSGGRVRILTVDAESGQVR